MRERRQNYRIRVPSDESVPVLLHIDGRDLPVELKDESVQGFGVQCAQELSVAEGDELHLQTPQGWFAVKVVRIVWNSDGSVYLGLRRGPGGRPAVRRDRLSLSRTTLVLAVVSGALIIPVVTFLLQSPARHPRPKSAPQVAIPVAKTSVAAPDSP